MANSNRNLLTQTYSGKVGNQFVMKTLGDKSIIAAKPKRRKLAGTGGAVQSLAVIKKNFRRAVIFAKTVMQNPVLKELYTAGRRKNQSAYNVAFADAIKGPELSDLITENYSGAAGQQIQVGAIDNFKVTGVNFTLFLADGSKLEEGDAVLDDNGSDWIYTTQLANPALPGTKVRVTAMDIPKNRTTLEVTI